MALLTPKACSLCLLPLVATAAALFARAESPGFDEYEVKAAYLYNFAKFVEWPARAFQGSDDPISICLLGESPLGRSLKQAVDGKKVGTRSFAVHELSSAQSVKACHILFVSDSERGRLRSILRDAADSHLLTVGESANFTSSGGVINFKLRDSRIRFEIDAETASRAGLRISSKLLSLAENTRR